MSDQLGELSRRVKKTEEVVAAAWEKDQRKLAEDRALLSATAGKQVAAAESAWASARSTIEPKIDELKARVRTPPQRTPATPRHRQTPDPCEHYPNRPPNQQHSHG